MRQSIGYVSSGRFHSDRFQKRVIRTSGCVPDQMQCPECHHGYDIVVSRRQVFSGNLSRRFIRHFHCRICGCRFTRWNPEAVSTSLRVTMTAAAITGIVLLPNWLL